MAGAEDRISAAWRINLADSTSACGNDLALTDSLGLRGHEE